MISTDEQQLQEARRLMKEKRFSEAREVIIVSNHPLSDQWLAQVDQRARLENISLEDLKDESPIGASNMIIANDVVTPDITRQSKLPADGFALVSFVAMFGGVAMGWLLHFSSLFIFVALFSVVIAAWIAGRFIRSAIRVGKVRDGRTVWLLGALMGALLYGTYWTMMYDSFVQDVVMDGFERTEIDAMLEEMTGEDGFLGYLLLVLREPVPVVYTSLGFIEDAEDFGGILDGGLIVPLYIVELLAALLIPASVARGMAKRQFNENTNAWA